MTDVIKLVPKNGDGPPPKKPGIDLEAFVWTCNGCGNSTFQLIKGGAVRCAHCNLYQPSVTHTIIERE